MTEPEQFNQRKKRPYEKRLEKQTTFEAALKTLVEKLAPPSDPEQDKLEECREKCRKGNPFPLIAMQWPEMVLTDEKEIAIFRKYLTPERFADTTDQVSKACCDPSNPPLRLDWWQMMIIAAYFDVTITEINVKGCTGAGKGGSTSIAICLWYDVYEECRIYVTGRDRQNALDNVFGETKKWFNRMKHQPDARILGESITSHERRSVQILQPEASSANAGEAFSGKHGSNTLYIFDEATAHPECFVDNAVRNAKKIVQLGNPRHRLGAFYRAFEKMGIDRINKTGMCYGRQGMRLNVTVGGMDCINVAEGRLKEPVAPEGGMEFNGCFYKEGARIPDSEFAEYKFLIPEQIDTIQYRARLIEAMSECYANGHFPKEDAELQLILPSWLPRHEEAWNENIPITAIGVDAAASIDGDESVFAFGGETGCRSIHSLRVKESGDIARQLLHICKDVYGIDLEKDNSIPVCIDYGGGYGGGVGSYLKDLGVWVIEFVPTSSSSRPRNYANLRAEGYAALGLRLDPQGPYSDKTYALPQRSGLREELCAPERQYAPDGVRFHISPKKEIKKALGRSPDAADAIVYMFHGARIRHDIDSWLFNLRNRALVCHPQTAEEAIVRKIETEKEPPPKTEWDDIPFDWLPPKSTNESGERRIEVTPPDKYQREPWWARYTKDE